MWGALWLNHRVNPYSVAVGDKNNAGLKPHREDKAMSQRKAEIIKELESCIKEVQHLHYTKITAVSDLVNSAYTAQLELEESCRVIHTPEELEALDPDTLMGSYGEASSTTFSAKHILATDYLEFLMFPIVVVATGEQVRAVREALEQGNA